MSNPQPSNSRSMPNLPINSETDKEEPPKSPLKKLPSALKVTTEPSVESPSPVTKRKSIFAKLRALKAQKNK